MGSRGVPDAGSEPRLRRDRVPELPAGCPEPARPQHSPGLPTGRNRRAQVPGAIPRDDGHGAQRAAARAFLDSNDHGASAAKNTRVTNAVATKHTKNAKPTCLLLCAACVSAVALLTAQATEPAEQLRRGDSMYADGRYADAITAFEHAAESADASIAQPARKGIVRSALRVGEFTLARRTAALLSENAGDAESLTLAGDALWAAGFFDEADREYARALAVDGQSPRAHFGIARSLASRSQLTEALSEVDF